MKNLKSLTTSIAVIMLCMLAVSVCAAEITDISGYETASVVIDGTPFTFPDTVPIIVNGRTLVPMRAIFEKLGASIYWDGDTETVIATKGDTTIVVQIDNNIMVKNNVTTVLDVPALLVQSRTLVPLRAVVEAFNCSVGWDDATNTVTITTVAQ